MLKSAHTPFRSFYSLSPTETTPISTMPIKDAESMAEIDGSLQSCLTKGLTALCREKPQEPIRWLAHWLLEHNPNAPKVSVRTSRPPTPAPDPNSASKPLSKSEASELISARSGKQLQTGTTLVRVACASRSVNSDVSYPMPGVTDFCHITAYRIACVGPCDALGVGHVIEAMQQGASGRAAKMLWISLLNTPFIYINNSPYALRAYDKSRATLEFTNGPQLRDMETMLKQDVETEIGNGRGRILLHSDGEDRWQSVPHGAVRTPQEMVLSATTGTSCVYTPLPAPAAAPLPRATMDLLLNLLTDKSLHPPPQEGQTAIVFCSEADAPAATAAQVAAYMAARVRAADGKMPADVLPLEPAAAANPTFKTDKWSPPRGLLEEVPHVVAVMTALGEAGADAKLLVDDAVDNCSARHHLRRIVESAAAAAGGWSSSAAAGSTDAAAAARRRDGLAGQYAQLIIMAAIILAAAPDRPPLDTAAVERAVAALDSPPPPAAAAAARPPAAAA